MLPLVVGAIVLVVPFKNNALAQGAYIGQVDGSSAPSGGRLPLSADGPGPGVYLDQLPQSARPRPAPQPRRVVRHKKAARIVEAPKPMLPDVGAGVNLAVPESARGQLLPNVGRGTVSS